MNEMIIKENIKIENYIYEVRGKQVMLDSDLARLYHCKNGTKEINQAVKNNLEKFPERFSWVLNDDEYNILRSKILTANGTFSNKKGQIYDAYSLLLNIINSAKDSIIIIDNYVSKELLDILSKTNKKIVIYSKNLNDNLINKYNSQYDNVIFKIDDSYHDRFIIIDNKDVVGFTEIAVLSYR